MLVKIGDEYHTHPYYMGDREPGVTYPGSQKDPPNFDKPLPELTDQDKNYNEDFDHDHLIDGGSFPKVSKNLKFLFSKTFFSVYGNS